VWETQRAVKRHFVKRLSSASSHKKTTCALDGVQLTMLGHTDGAESNALSMKRRLDEHKDDEGQSDKRHKNEQGAPAHLAHQARPRLRSCILLQPRSPARPRLCASTSDCGADVRTVAAAASASINGNGASVNNLAAAASASINGCEAPVNNVMAAASASIKGSGASVKTAVV